MVVQAAATARTIELLTLIRLRTLLAEGQVPTIPLGYSDAETAAIQAIADVLIAEDLEQQRLAAYGFMQSEGEHAGVPRESAVT
jgi:hypothetical protein